MRARGRLLLGEVHAPRRGVGEAVGGDQRREDRKDDEQQDDGHAGVEDPLRHTARRPDLGDEPPEPRQAPGLERGSGGRTGRQRCGGNLLERHEYLTLGSTNALRRSIRTETNTTASAKMVMIPCTAT